MVKYLKCENPHCPAPLNDPQAQLCAACSANLLDATPVYEEPGEPVGAAAAQALPTIGTAPGPVPGEGASVASVISETARFTVRIPGLGPLPVGRGILIGRGAPGVRPDVATVLAPCRGVSRQHLWLGTLGRELIAIDLGSRNGTCARGARLSPWCLHSVTVFPATIELGARLTIEISDEETR